MQPLGRRRTLVRSARQPLLASLYLANPARFHHFGSGSPRNAGAVNSVGLGALTPCAAAKSSAPSVPAVGTERILSSAEPPPLLLPAVELLGDVSNGSAGFMGHLGGARGSAPTLEPQQPQPSDRECLEGAAARVDNGRVSLAPLAASGSRSLLTAEPATGSGSTQQPAAGARQAGGGGAAEDGCLAVRQGGADAGAEADEEDGAYGGQHAAHRRLGRPGGGFSTRLPVRAPSLPPPQQLEHHQQQQQRHGRGGQHTTTWSQQEARSGSDAVDGRQGLAFGPPAGAPRTQEPLGYQQQQQQQQQPRSEGSNMAGIKKQQQWKQPRERSGHSSGDQWQQHHQHQHHQQQQGRDGLHGCPPDLAQRETPAAGPPPRHHHHHHYQQQQQQVPHQQQATGRRRSETAAPAASLIHARHCLSRSLAAAPDPHSLMDLLEGSLGPERGLMDPVCLSAAVCRMARLEGAAGLAGAAGGPGWAQGPPGGAWLAAGWWQAGWEREPDRDGALGGGGRREGLDVGGRSGGAPMAAGHDDDDEEEEEEKAVALGDRVRSAGAAAADVGTATSAGAAGLRCSLGSGGGGVALVVVPGPAASTGGVAPGLTVTMGPVARRAPDADTLVSQRALQSAGREPAVAGGREPGYPAADGPAHADTGAGRGAGAGVGAPQPRVTAQRLGEEPSHHAAPPSQQPQASRVSPAATAALQRRARVSRFLRLAHAALWQSYTASAGADSTATAGTAAAAPARPNAAAGMPPEAWSRERACAAVPSDPNSSPAGARPSAPAATATTRAAAFYEGPTSRPREGAVAAGRAAVRPFRPREVANVMWGLACLRAPDARLCGSRASQALLLRVAQQLLPPPRMPSSSSSSSLPSSPLPSPWARPQTRGGEGAVERGGRGQVAAAAPAGGDGGVGAVEQDPRHSHGRRDRLGDSSIPSTGTISSGSSGLSSNGLTSSSSRRGSAGATGGSGTGGDYAAAYGQARWRPGELSMLAWAMARAEVRPPSRRWLLSYLTAWDEQMLAAAAPSELACLTWALAQWQRKDVGVATWWLGRTRQVALEKTMGQEKDKKKNKTKKAIRWRSSRVPTSPWAQEEGVGEGKAGRQRRWRLAAAAGSRGRVASVRSCIPDAWLEAFWAASLPCLQRTAALSANAAGAAAAAPGAVRDPRGGGNVHHQGMQQRHHHHHHHHHQNPQQQYPQQQFRRHAVSAQADGTGSSWRINRSSSNDSSGGGVGGSDGYAALSGRPPPPLQQQQQQQQLWGPSELAMLLWSVGSLGLQPPQAWAEAALRAAAATAPSAPPLALATTLYGAARFGARAPLLTPDSQAAATSEARSGTQPALHPSRVPQAAASDHRTGASSSSASASSGEQSEPETTTGPGAGAEAESPEAAAVEVPTATATASSPSPSSSSHAYPFPRPRRPPPVACQSLLAAFARAYLRRCAAALQSFGPSQVVDLLAAVKVLSSSGHLPPPAAMPLPLPALLDVAAVRLQRCYALGLGPRHLLVAASSLAALGHTPPAEWLDWWLAEMYDSFRRGSLRGQDLEAVLRTLAAFGVVPGPNWSSALLAAAACRLPYMGRTAMTSLLEAMAQAGLRLRPRHEPNPNPAEAAPEAEARASARHPAGVGVGRLAVEAGGRRSSVPLEGPRAAEAPLTADAGGAEEGAAWTWLAEYLRLWAGRGGRLHATRGSPLPCGGRQATRLCDALLALAGPAATWPPGPRAALAAALRQVPLLRRQTRRGRGATAAATGEADRGCAAAAASSSSAGRSSRGRPATGPPPAAWVAASGQGGRQKVPHAAAAAAPRGASTPLPGAWRDLAPGASRSRRVRVGLAVQQRGGRPRAGPRGGASGVVQSAELLQAVARLGALPQAGVLRP